MGTLTQPDYVEILDKAEAKDPGNPFVSSCYAFLRQRGFLSNNQIASLNKISRTRHHRHSDDYEELNFGENDNFNNLSDFD